MMNDVGTRILQETAKAEVQSLAETRRVVLEEHSHSFRWLTASLLALNAGGLVAVLNADSISAFWKISVGAAFGAGCVFALLVAVAAQRMNLKGLAPLQAQIGYWVSVTVDGTRDNSIEADLDRQLRETLKLSWVGRVLGWLSGLAFIIGLVIASCGLTSSRADDHVKSLVDSRNSSGPH